MAKPVQALATPGGGIESFDDIDVEQYEDGPDLTSATPQNRQKAADQSAETIDSFDDVDEEALRMEEEERLKAEKGDEEDEVDPKDHKKTMDEEEDKEVVKKKDEKNEDSEEPSKKGKAIKAKLGDEKLSLDPEMTFKQKVDGEEQEVTLREALNSWSGEQHFKQKYDELGVKNQQAEQKIQESTQKIEEFEQNRTQLANDMAGIIQKLEDGKGNPLDGVYKLLDWAGRDVLSFEKRVHEALYEQFKDMSEMDDVELELFWRNKEVEYLRKQNEVSASRNRQTSEESEARKQIDDQRKARGVSEEDFAQAYDSLIEQAKESGEDLEGITVDDVLELAVTGPLVMTAEDLSKEYLEELGDEEAVQLISSVVKFLKDGYSEEEIAETLRDSFGKGEVETDPEPEEETVDELPLPKREKKDPESFDDFDIY
jgi:hypothetical protein